MEAMTASYSDYAGGFRWERGVTPMSSVWAVAAAEAAYLGTVFGLRALLGGQPLTALSDAALKRAMAVHNLVLCLLSLAMFCGCLLESVRVATTSEDVPSHGDVGWSFLLCIPPGAVATGRLYWWSYVYYLSKFLEFGDTVFKVLRGKPLDFLHVYHHAMVVLMCWLWLDQVQSLQQLGLLFNTGIHVFMYYYYFRSTFTSSPPWWKFIVTNGQIVQFQSSFLISIGLLVLQWRHTGGLRGILGLDDYCSGYRAFLFNVGFNLSLLLLFIDFKKKTYGSPNKQA